MLSVRLGRWICRLCRRMLRGYDTCELLVEIRWKSLRRWIGYLRLSAQTKNDQCTAVPWKHPPRCLISERCRFLGYPREVAIQRDGWSGWQNRKTKKPDSGIKPDYIGMVAKESERVCVNDLTAGFWMDERNTGGSFTMVTTTVDTGSIASRRSFDRVISWSDFDNWEEEYCTGAELN